MTTNVSKRLTLSVVICAHNEEAWIGRTLASLAQQKRLPDEVVVVNNASTDRTEAIIQEFIAAHLAMHMILVNEPTKGLHHAREAGWRAAHGDIIVNTDADVTFPANWLQIIEAAFADPEVAAVGGIIRFDDALPIANWVTWACDLMFQPEGIGKRFVNRYLLTGGNSAYRRQVLEAVDGYRNQPVGQLEDQYLSEAIQEKGYKVKLLRNLKIWHTFRRFKKLGWRGYLRYMSIKGPDDVYEDHLADVADSQSPRGDIR